jgi:hypothetical protein
MQTFVPLTSTVDDIAKVLDNKRLNKQALEGWQILMTLLELDPQGNHRVPKGWYNHPAVKMWRGHEMALFMYVNAMVEEWKSRGYKSTIGVKAWSTIQVAMSKGLVSDSNLDAPQWIEDKDLFEQIASSHRTALLNKDYEWYSQFGWAEDTGTKPETYDYIWPVN